MRGVCRWGFAELGLARVLAFKGEAVAGNTASWRVVEKLGFVREGTLRAFLVQRGVRKDAWTGSLLRGEAGREGTE